MAAIIGNFEESNPTPNGNSVTWQHEQNAGSDGFLLVSVGMSNSQSFVSATYGGQPMEILINETSNSLSQTWAVFGLIDPPTGTNDVVITLSGNQWNPLAYFSQSFTNCSGAGQRLSNDTSSQPHTEQITVVDDSLVYVVSTAVFGGQDFEVDGVTYPLKHEGNTNRQYFGGMSTTPLTAGSIDVVTKADTGDVTNVRVEILAAGGAAARRIFLIT